MFWTAGRVVGTIDGGTDGSRDTWKASSGSVGGAFGARAPLPDRRSAGVLWARVRGVQGGGQRTSEAASEIPAASAVAADERA